MAGALLAVTAWGLAPVATRSAVTHLAPVPLLVMRLTLAALVLLPWALPVFRSLRPRSAGRLLAAAALGLVGYNLPVTLGLQWLPASTAGLLLATEPIWVIIIGYAFGGERADTRVWLGSAIALAGVLALAGSAALAGASQHGAGASGYREIAGAGLVLAGTLAFGGYTIVARPLSASHGAVPATAASTVVGAACYLALAPALPALSGMAALSAPRLTELPAVAWGDIGFLAIGSTVAGMLLWNRAVLSIGSTRASLLLYFEPVVSVLGALAFLHERLTAMTIAGGLLILVGVAAALWGQRACPAPTARAARSRAPAPRRTRAR